MEIVAVIESHAHHFLQEIKTEGEGEKEAILIIRKYIREGKISDDEYHVIKTQLIDSFKIVGIAVPFVLIPGSSVLMPILIKVAARYNIELMPSAFIEQKKVARRS
jgi:hypothetical protein